MGVRCALDTPAAIERDLDRLLAAPSTDAGDDPPVGRHPEYPLKATRLALRLLARLPGGRWRNTCLYRSAAECLTLRRLGVPARVCLGVGKEEALSSITAHAWIEVAVAGDAAGSSPLGMNRLASPRKPSLENRD